MACNDQNRKFSLWCFGCSGVLFLIVGIGVVGASFLAPLMHAGRSSPFSLIPYAALVALILLIFGFIFGSTTTPGDGDNH